MILNSFKTGGKQNLQFPILYAKMLSYIFPPPKYLLQKIVFSRHVTVMAWLMALQHAQQLNLWFLSVVLPVFSCIFLHKGQGRREQGTWWSTSLAGNEEHHTVGVETVSLHFQRWSFMPNSLSQCSTNSSGGQFPESWNPKFPLQREVTLGLILPVLGLQLKLCVKNQISLFSQPNWSPAGFDGQMRDWGLFQLLC